LQRELGRRAQGSKVVVQADHEQGDRANEHAGRDGSVDRPDGRSSCSTGCGSSGDAQTAEVGLTNPVRSARARARPVAITPPSVAVTRTATRSSDTSAMLRRVPV
jgi:hypothetical protein